MIADGFHFPWITKKTQKQVFAIDV